MFGCLFVQTASIYCISSLGDTLLGLSGKGNSCTIAFLCCTQDTIDQLINQSNFYNPNIPREKSIHPKTMKDHEAQE